VKRPEPTAQNAAAFRDRMAMPRLSPELEREYGDDFAVTNSRITSIGITVMAVVVCVHFVITYVFFPEGMPPVSTALRLYVTIMVVATGAQILNRYALRLGSQIINLVAVSALLIISWAVIDAVMAAAPERRSLGFAVIQCLLVVSYMLFRIRFNFAVACGLAISALYFYTVDVHQVYDRQRFLQVLLYLSLTNAVGVIVAFFLERQDRLIFLSLKELEQEREKSDAIIGNLLPPAVASRLKDSQAPSATLHPEVTLLSADIVGFTKLAAQMPPEEIVMILSTVFTEFDRIVERHGIEKIKTIGDAYVAAGGLPGAQFNHAVHACRAAGEMLRAVKQLSLRFGFDLEVRIGLDSGPVVAGVTGGDRPSYDVWGHTVVTAKEIEVASAPGTVRISAATAEHVMAYFDLEPSAPIRLEDGRLLRTFQLIALPTRHFVLKPA